MSKQIITGSKVLVTGGAGFIGSNLVDTLLKQGNKVICLDNFATGKISNIEEHLLDKNFVLLKGDIRNLNDCMEAVDGVNHILHQAALGSVPRSINDPITTNEVNISGFLNILVAAKEQGVKRVVYAASSSTYGDHPMLPKTEENIGTPLSPYAVTKYVNELYATVFSNIYGIETVGLRYFNVFGKKQTPDGPYAAVIPKFIKQLIDYESPIIHGDGEQSRDFTYIENVIQANQLAALTTNKNAVNNVYNVAYGEKTNLVDLFNNLKELLSFFDEKIGEVEHKFGSERKGDVKHSLASIDKSKNLLNYNPKYDIRKGLEEAINWYWENLK